MADLQAGAKAKNARVAGDHHHLDSAADDCAPTDVYALAVAAPPAAAAGDNHYPDSAADDGAHTDVQALAAAAPPAAAVGDHHLDSAVGDGAQADVQALAAAAPRAAATPATAPPAAAGGLGEANAMTGVGSLFVKTTGTLDLSLEDPSLLRGVSLPKLLRGFGRHFRARALADQRFTEAEATWLYAHSQEVQWLHEFLSHSWRDSAFKKFLALCLYYNALPAALLSFLLSLVLLGLEITGYMPGWTHHTWESPAGEERISMSFCGSAVGVVVYPLALLTWHHAPHWLAGGRDRAVFFDKLCVHQTDPDRKAAGIRSFGAFIANAERLLVLWSPGYFGRLWCTLEVAVFVHLRHSQKAAYEGVMARSLVIRPLQLAGFVWAAIATLQVFIVLYLTAYALKNMIPVPVLPLGLVAASTLFLPLPLALRFARNWMRDLDALNVQLNEFSIESASCFSDADRELVYASIQNWFGSLKAFNSHVRHNVSNLVKSQLPDRTHLPLAFTSCVHFVLINHVLDWMAAIIRFKDTKFASTCMVELLVAPMLVELTICLVVRIGEAVERRRRFARYEIIIDVPCGVLCALPGIVLHFSAKFLRNVGVLSMLAYDVFVLGLLLLARGDLVRLGAAGSFGRGSSRGGGG